MIYVNGTPPFDFENICLLRTECAFGRSFHGVFRTRALETRNELFRHRVTTSFSKWPRFDIYFDFFVSFVFDQRLKYRYDETQIP